MSNTPTLQAAWNKRNEMMTEADLIMKESVKVLSNAAMEQWKVQRDGLGVMPDKIEFFRSGHTSSISEFIEFLTESDKAVSDYNQKHLACSQAFVKGSELKVKSDEIGAKADLEWALAVKETLGDGANMEWSFGVGTEECKLSNGEVYTSAYDPIVDDLPDIEQETPTLN